MVDDKVSRGPRSEHARAREGREEGGREAVAGKEAQGDGGLYHHHAASASGRVDAHPRNARSQDALCSAAAPFGRRPMAREEHPDCMARHCAFLSQVILKGHGWYKNKACSQRMHESWGMPSIFCLILSQTWRWSLHLGSRILRAAALAQAPITGRRAYTRGRMACQLHATC